jgi:hypothetical protein
MATKQLTADQATEYVLPQPPAASSFDGACRYVRKRKGDINPNPRFKKELKEYEKVAAAPRTSSRSPTSAAPLRSMAQVILGDGAMVCGLPVIFESLCEKKGGGPDGQRNWFKVSSRARA